MNGNFLLALTLDQVKDEKIEARVPAKEKAKLLKEAKAKGFRGLSSYIRAIVMGRGKP